MADSNNCDEAAVVVDERLIDATHDEDIQRVQELLDEGVDVNSKDRFFGKTALFYAVEEELLEITKLLLNNNADPHAKGNDGGTTMMDAMQSWGNLEVIDLMMEKVGANNIHLTNNDGDTLLNLACHRGLLDIAKLLVEKGADIHLRNDEGNGSTPLHEACHGKNLEMIKWLIENGAVVGATDKDGDTPLHEACRGKHLEIVKWLIENGAVVRAKNIYYANTPLHIACFEKHVEIAKLLIENGAVVRAKNDRGDTPLHIACRERHLEMVKLLSDNGADLNAQNKNGDTPIRISCFKLEFIPVRMSDLGTRDMTDFWIENRNNTRNWNVFGETCFEVAQLLIDNGADVDAEDPQGKTTLHQACEDGFLGVVQFLLRNRADPRKKTSSSSQDDHRGPSVTPLDLACEGNHIEVVWFMVHQLAF